MKTLFNVYTGHLVEHGNKLVAFRGGGGGGLAAPPYNIFSLSRSVLILNRDVVFFF
jgi:hypothetical protein